MHNCPKCRTAYTIERLVRKYAYQLRFAVASFVIATDPDAGIDRDKAREASEEIWLVVKQIEWLTRYLNERMGVNQ